MGQFQLQSSHDELLKALRGWVFQMGANWGSRYDAWGSQQGFSWAGVCLVTLSPISLFLEATLVKEAADAWISLLL